MTGWRDRWDAVVASDVSARDGLGWEFTSRDRSAGVWAVFREDGGLFPVFSSARGDGDLPSRQDLRAMTEEAVADLLVAAAHPDEAGRIKQNISAALMTASLEIVSAGTEVLPERVGSVHSDARILSIMGQQRGEMARIGRRSTRGNSRSRPGRDLAARGSRRDSGRNPT